MAVTPQCDKGHPLEEKKMKMFSGWVHARECEGCQREIQRGETRYHCPDGCDFDLCQGCFDTTAAGVAVQDRPNIAAGAPPKCKNDLPPMLPFVPQEPPEVDRRLSPGDEIYLYTESGGAGGYLACDSESEAVTANTEEPTGKCVLVIETPKPKSGQVARIGAAEEVRLRFVASGMYLNCDEETVRHRGEEPGDGGRFILHKIGRPLRARHNDTVFLLSRNLDNFIEVKAGGGALQARWWKMGKQFAFTIKKKAVVDYGPSPMLRELQFKAFDLDGNGTIARAEMQYVMGKADHVSSASDMDDLMNAADPDGTGLTKEKFIDWANSGSIDEDTLQRAQVLGNIAQRCSDCINDEWALIEVLAQGVSVQRMNDVRLAYQKLFKEDLRTKAISKAKEADGVFRSDYWQVAMRGLFEEEVDLWVRALNDAMKGWGTDENTLLSLVCTIPDRLRDEIFEKYEKQFGQSLRKHIESETSFSFKKVLMIQADTPAGARVQLLKDSMDGMGTDEDQLIRIIVACDLNQRKEICELYERRHNKNLLERIKSETGGSWFGGDLQKCLIGMLEADDEEFDVDADCLALKEAMDGWGTSEIPLIQKICSKSPKQMEILKDRFKENYDRPLEAWVASETSGRLKTVLVGCLRHPMVELAHAVRACIEGFGTTEIGLITLLTHLPDYKRVSLRETYRKELQRNLLDDISGDCSGDFKRALLACVKDPPTVWAEALKGAMKGLGTSDELLINFMCISKDNMSEVRTRFWEENGEHLYSWIKGDCSGDYARTLEALACRNSDEEVELLPVYWAQRLHDALHDVPTLIEVLTPCPSIVLKRSTEIFQEVYSKSLKDEIEKKCGEGAGFFSFSKNWKDAMVAQLDLPAERRARACWDAMKGFGTDEYTLTGVICTIPENQHQEIMDCYAKIYKGELFDHVKSETSSDYKEALLQQIYPKAASRARILYNAMKGGFLGIGTDEKQLIRVIICSTMKEREKIAEAYHKLFKSDLIKDVEGEISGSFKAAMVGILKSCALKFDQDYDADCDALKAAMDGFGTDEEALVRKISGKSPAQVEILKETWASKFPEDGPLLDRVLGETTGMFESGDFRETITGLLREPDEQLCRSINYCIAGWGTSELGLTTLLSHLSEQRREVIKTKYELIFNSNLVDDIKGDCSGCYETALLSMIRKPVEVWAEALKSSMKGLGTSDMLLINWMCISKDRMDEVRDAFQEQTGGSLVEWIEGDCSGDYKNTLVGIANRQCLKFPGCEAQLTVPPCANEEDCVRIFRDTFIKCCKGKKKEPDETYIIHEEEAQMLGMAFMFFGQNSSCTPDMDKQSIWTMTNAISSRFIPQNQEDDLDATFYEWNYSGSGQICWNDFVQEMQARVNDEQYWEADNGGLF